MRALQPSFKDGVLSPATFGMSRLDGYNMGCRTLDDAIVTETGSARKRWGSEYISLTQFADNAKVMPFRVRGYNLVATVYHQNADSNVYLRLYAHDEVLGSISEVTSSPQQMALWDLEEVASVAWVSDRDTLYMASGTGPTYRLTFDGDLADPVSSFSGWTLDYVGNDSIYHAPVVRQIGPDFSLTFSTGASLTAGAPYFSGADIGAIYMFNNSFFHVTGYQSPTIVTGDIFTDYNVPSNGEATNDWYGPYLSVGAVGGTITPEADAVGESGSATYTGDTAAEDEIVPGAIIALNASGIGSDPVIEVLSVNYTSNSFTYRVVRGSTTATGFASATAYHPSSRLPGADLFIFSGTAGTVYSWDQKLTSGHRASAGRFGAEFIVNGGWIAIGSDLPVDDQYPFGENQAMGEYNRTARIQYLASFQDGFPSALAIHQGRMVASGFSGNPGAVAMSSVDRPDDWKVGSNARDALAFEINDVSGAAIKWVKSGEELFVGTEDGEWKVTGSPITATSIGVEQQSAYGGAGVQPEFAGAAIFFVPRDRKGIREMLWRFQEDRYVSRDLSDKAKHLFESDPIREIVHLRDPYPVTVFVRDSGTIVTLSYERESGIEAWSDWSSMGAVHGVGVVNGTDEDELWIVADIPAGSATMVCRMKPSLEQYMDWSFTDASPGSTTISGLNHLEDQTVQVIADGAYIGRYVVDTGAITLETAGTPSSVTVGQEIPTEVEMQMPESTIRGAGPTEGFRKSFQSLKVYVRNCQALKVNDRFVDATNLPDESTTAPASPPTSPPPAQSGWTRCPSLGHNPTNEDTPRVQLTAPFAGEVCAVVAELEFGTE